VVENPKTINDLDSGSNPYEAIFNESYNNEIKIQDKFSPYPNTNKKANSYPEMNSLYPSFTVSDEIKKESSEIFNFRGYDENKSNLIYKFYYFLL